ncbi:MAG: hypothetical protein FJZ09_02225 [Candidatus Omnitrophica bacterium]|nr:hypothetical protein [Candidatus Omnitrophota bacterium]
MQVIIRPYRKADRKAVRQIAWDTAFMGRPADAFFSGKALLTGFLTRYFTEYEPQSSFVAESEGSVVGYLLGAKDTAVLARIFKAKILPGLILQAVFSGALFRKKNLAFFRNCWQSLRNKEFRMPDLSRDYPATLHINLTEAARGEGTGAKLIAAYLDHLRKNNAAGVHLATLSQRASVFFQAQGFTLLYEARRTYFRHILKDDLTLSVFGMRL